jgi:PAS domain S-box-containing protein
MKFDFEKHLAETQRLAHVGTWEWDVSNDSILWTDEHYRIFGLSRDSFTPSFRAALPYVHPDDRAALQAIVEHSIAEHVAFQCEYRVIRPDGAIRTVNALGAWSGVPGESAHRMYGTAQDITQRKHIEDALRESEHRLRLLLEERRRLSRDLHDKLLQDLYAIGLSLDGLRRTAADIAENAAVIVGGTIAILEGAITAARKLVDGSHPLSTHDLEQELKAIAAAAESVRPISVAANVDRGALDRIATPAREDVLNIVREAVSNCLRHSDASMLIIAVDRSAIGVRVAVQDDGKGFEPGRRPPTGRGLCNMASRARAIGGALEIRSRSPRGTLITLEIAVSGRSE